ncbi:MAG: PAS domain S-box protein [Flavobacteriales bacterium]|nr:PAS domain S-box protein [Flavobacteriales bacterium]
MSKISSKPSYDSTLFEKIQRDRAFLESVFDRIPGMIYIHDLENDVNLYRSWTLKKILGLAESEKMKTGRAIRSLVHPEDVNEFKQAAKKLQLLDDNNCVQFNYRMKHASGKWLWFRGEEYVYERNVEGKPIKCLGYTTDLTETVEKQQELDSLNQYNEFLLKAAQILSKPTNKYPTGLQELAESVSHYFGGVCDVSILHHETGIIRPEAVYHLDEEVRNIILKLFNHRLVRKGQGLVGSVIETGEEILLNDVPEEMRVGPRSIDSRIVPRSMLYVPLKGANGVLGSLNVTRLEGDSPFNDVQISRIRRLGEYVSLFVENGILKEREAIETFKRQSAENQLEKEKKWAEFKLDVSSILTDVDSDLLQVLQILCVRITNYFDVVTDVQLLNEETNKIQLVALHHNDIQVKTEIEKRLKKRELEIGEGMVGKVVESGKEYFASKLPEELRKKSAQEGVNPLIVPSSFVYLPLKSHDKILGTLDFTRLGNQEGFTEYELMQMRDLAGHAARFIDNRLLHLAQKKEIHLRKKTELKLERTTKILERSEADIRATLNAIPIYISRISTDLKYVFLNDAYHHLGQNPRKMEGKYIGDVIGEDAVMKLQPQFNKVLSGETVAYEYEGTMADGAYRYFNVALAPDYSEHGEVIGFYSCSIDMTTKVLAERAAKLTQDRLESLSLNSGDAFFFHDVEQNILDVNQVATEMLGYTRDELLNMKAFQIDPVWKGKLYQRFLELLEVNVPQTFDTKVFHKNGTEVPVEVRFVKRIEGNQVYIQSLMRDRTDKRDQEIKLQQSEERLRLIFDNVEDFIAIISEDGVFESINKTAQGLTIEDVVGSTIFDFSENLDRVEVLRASFNRLKTEGLNFELSETYKGPDGSRLIYSRKYIGIFHGEKFYKAILIIRDITAERDREQTVMNAVLRGQEQERKRLGAELHDGIGQVLSAITLQVSQIRQEVSDNDVETITADLSKLNSNLQEAIREVRNISHDLMPEVLESFGLKEAINQTCSNLHDRSGINVKFDYIDIEARYNQLIEVNLYRILQELLNNIQKHASCKKVFVSLIDHGDSLNLSVEDDGVGFDIHGASSGIGLTNVISRVNSMNGQIDIESAEKSGTLINIDVPKTPK